MTERSRHPAGRVISLHSEKAILTVRSRHMAHSEGQFIGLPAIAFVPRKAFHGHQTEAPRLDYSQRLQRLSRYPPHSQQAVFSGQFPDRESADIEYSHGLVFMPGATLAIFGFIAVRRGGSA